MIVDKINQWLTENNSPELPPDLLDSVGKQASYIFDRQFGLKEERSGGMYLSSVGKCMRQQAYKLHNFAPNGKEIDSRARMVFFQGDMAELAVVYLAKLAGIRITDEQKNVSIEGVPGHPDGVAHFEDMPRLLEVKSMASYSFERFEKGDIDDSYIAQINAYLDALDLQECIMVGMNKDAGVLGERVINRDEKVISDNRRRITIVKSSTTENLPSPAYTHDDKGLYPWQCLYCSHWKTCRPNAEIVLVGRSNKLREKRPVNV